MKKLLLVLLMLGMAVSQAEEGDSPVQSRKFMVGFGGGFEAGNGLRLGMSRGKDAVELGLGLLYKAQDAEFQYSLGLRYLRTLYAGQVNDTYAWTGAGVMGHNRSGDNGRLASVGAGLGISIHFGLPFHFNVDSGWHIYDDSQSIYGRIQSGPTINGAVVYEW
jgi:hypothetical protein